MPPVDQLSRAFSALSDPTRRVILTRLKHGPVAVSTLAANYAMSRPAISQYLNVLERAGLIARQHRSQWRECTVDQTGLESVSTWIEALRAEWTERFDLLEEQLSAKRGSARP